MRAKSLLLTAVCLAGWLVSSVQAQQGVRWQQTLQMAKQVAAQSNRLVLLHFWAPSCGACLKMEQEVFSRPDVAAALDVNYVAVKLNADFFPSTARQYGVTALPTDLVLTSQGQLVEKLVGFRPSAEYIAGMNWIANNAKATNARVYAQIPGAATQGPESGGPGANSMPPGQVGPGAGFAGPREPDYGGRQGSADNAAMAPTGPRADRGDRMAQSPAGGISTAPNVNQGAPSPYGNAAPGTGGSATPPGMTTAPNWPAYSNPVQPPQSGGPAFAGAAPSGSRASGAGAPSSAGAQNAPAWRLGGAAMPPGSNGVAQSGTAAPPSTTQPPAWQIPSGSSPSPGPTAGPTAKPAPMYPLALDGFCPVSLREKGRWVPGNRRWGAFHQGRTYLFVGAEEQERFLKNPEPYAPVLSGNDVVAMVEQGQTVPGQRRFGAWYDDHVYLFSSEAAYQKFYSDAPRYANAALQSMRPASTPSYR